MTRRPIAVIDSETDPFKFGRMPEPFIWGFYDGNVYLTFDSTKELAEYLQTQDIIVYAHNGGKFDYHFLLPYLNKKEKVMVINSRLAKWKLGKCELRDSYNILPVPLSAINKDVFDYTKMEKNVRHKHMPEIKAYLKNDCVYLYDAIIKYVNEYGLHLTQAGASFRVWQNRFDGETPRTSRGFYNEFSRYYFGGRVSCFESGVFNGNFDFIDINSAYPFAMRHKHPWGKECDMSKRWPKDHEIHRSFVTLTCYSAGAFPIRRENGSLDFPHEINTYHVTGHELMAALATDTIKNPKIEYSYIFQDEIDFTEYVDYFYQLKLDAEKSGDKASRLFAKLFMNSLYGKFAANPDRYKEYIIDNFDSHCPEGYAHDAAIGNKQLYSRPLPEPIQRWYNIATAASITGWVRGYLWKAINQVENPLYCDTDSIICKSTGNLPMGDKLGAWATEAKLDQVAIAGKKLYACRLKDGSYKTASKGARLKPHEIIKVAKGQDITYKPDAPTFSLSLGNRFTTRLIRKTA